MIRIFTTEVCPKCKRLKAFLEKEGIAYETLDMQTPEGMTELLCNSVFTYTAPVLQVGEQFYITTQLFKGTELKEEFILQCVGK